MKKLHYALAPALLASCLIGTAAHASLLTTDVGYTGPFST